VRKKKERTCTERRRVRRDFPNKGDRRGGRVEQRRTSSHLQPTGSRGRVSQVPRTRSPIGSKGKIARTNQTIGQSG